LLAHELAKDRGRLHGFPVEYPQVPAELVARREWPQLAADESTERRFARGDLRLLCMRDLVRGQGAEGRAQNLAVEALLAGKVIVDGRLVDPRLGDDGADAGALVAALGEQPFGCLHDPLAGDFGWSSHCLDFQTPV